MKNKWILAFFLTCLLACESGAAEVQAICLEAQKLTTDKRAARQYTLDQKFTGDGNDTAYPHLDLNSDGVDDVVLQSRGYGEERIHALTLHLTNGKHFTKELNPFFLAKIDDHILAIESYKKIYLVTENSIKEICK